MSREGVVPSSLAMIRPRVVLPSPGGPCRSTWSRARRGLWWLPERSEVAPPVRVVQGSPTVVRDGPMVPRSDRPASAPA